MQNLDSKTQPFFFRINPLAKFATLFLIVVADLIFIFSSPVKIIVVFFVLLQSVQLAGNKFKRIFKNTIRFYPMIFALTLLLPFSGEGEIVGSIFSLNIYVDGLEKFLYHNLFMIILLLYSNLLVFTTPINEVINWLEKLKTPKKIITIMFLTGRFLSLMRIDIIKKANAFKSRYQTLSIKNKIIYSAKFLVSLIGNMLFQNEKIYFALASRNFKGEITVQSETKWQKYDFQFLIISITLLAFLIWI